MEILVIIWGILNIILFFKIWGACNNIKLLADKYAPETKEETYSLEKKEEIDNWLKE